MERIRLNVSDIPRFSTIGELAISPIGTRVAFTRQYMDLRNDKTKSEIWLAICYTSFCKRLTASDCRDSAPAWSPDGLRLAFISDRSGKRQLYLIDPDGGEATVISTREEPSGTPVWSPDGKAIAFTASVEMKPESPFYPGAPVVSAMSRAIELGISTGPASTASTAPAPAPAESTAHKPHKQPIVIKTMHHKQDGRGFFDNSFSHIFVVPSEPTAPGVTATIRQLTSGRYNHEAPVWSPDGRHILCIANREEPDDDPFWDRHLWLVEVTTGEMKRVLRENYRVREAAWARDGRLAFIGCSRPLERLSEIDELFVMDLDPGRAPFSWNNASKLAGALDRNAGMVAPSDTRLGSGKSLLWSPDCRHVYFTLASEGQSHVWKVAACGGIPEKVSPGDNRAVACPTLSNNGWLAYTSARVDEPDEIFTLSPKGVERKITAINADAAAQFSLVGAERLLYKGADDWDVEGWLIKPSGHHQGKPYPTVMVVHGGPHGMFGYGFSYQHQLLANAGFAVFYANPRASSGYGAAFHDAVEDDWGGKDFIDLMNGLDLLEKNGVADGERTGIAGWSFGGYMTCWAVGHTQRFRAAVAGACISNQHDRYGTSDIGPEDVETSVKDGKPWADSQVLLENSPIAYAGKVTTPLLLLCGELDLRCPISQTEQMYIALKRQGKTAVFVRYPAEYHALKQPSHVLDRHDRTVAWFEHYLKG